MHGQISPSSRPTLGPRLPRWLWPAIAAVAALIPVLPGFSTTRLFFARDLSSFFWGRHLWLRREWLSGHFPLWDPHVGGGQSAVADGLHQMFLLPAVLVRLIGNDVLGFNLWVIAPFALAAVGMWLFLARRSSPRAALLGAVAFATCGPVAAAGNFPNLSWSVATVPWVFWAVDGLIAAPAPRGLAAVAMTVGLQCLAGEPVTLFTTLGAAMSWAFVMGDEQARFSWPSAIRRSILTGCGVALGVLLAAVQLVPMVIASGLAERGDSIVPDTWSLRPTALVETLWLHLFGNYFEVQSLTEVPWMPLMYTGREPLLFSIYLGIPLLAVSIYGLAGAAARRLRLFWVAAGLVSLVGAFGSFTPIYPILRDHVPPFGTFRFPVKFIYVAVMAVASGAALGFDQLLIGSGAADQADRRREARARLVSLGFVTTAGALVAGFGAACIWLKPGTASALQAFATLLGDESGKAAAALMTTVARSAMPIAGTAGAVAVLLAVCFRRSGNRFRAVAAWALAVLVAGDLLVNAWGVNPVMDASRLREPAWLARTTGDVNSRFYVGGKRGGTLDSMDFDSSRGFEQAPGLRGSASRATLNVQAAFYPSAWGGRELLSYDLPVLWPRLFYATSKRFAEASREERDRFLDRTSVRFRILPQRRAGTRPPLMRIPQFYESFLFDFGDVTGPRAFVVPRVEILPDADQQVKALFAPGWEARSALVQHAIPTSGLVGVPQAAYATIRVDEANRTVVDAAADTGGGYLVLLDSFSDDWRVVVDAQPAVMARADGLFRAVHLAPGAHVVEFSYQPRAFVVGAAVSLLALLVCVLLTCDTRRVSALVAWMYSGGGA
jgi:hypothetical protein